MKAVQLTMGIIGILFFFAVGGMAQAQNTLDIEQTGDLNILDVVQNGDNNLIVGADTDGSINSALAAQQRNSIGGNSLTITQTGNDNQLGFFQESASNTSTTAHIQQLNGGNNLGVHVVVNGGGSTNLTVTQNGNETLTIKKIQQSGNYDVTVTQTNGFTTPSPLPAGVTSP